MKRYLLAAAAGSILAVASVLTTIPGSWAHVRFKMGLLDVPGETEAVVSSIRLFSATLAGFYMTDGDPEGLNAFPAERVIKRRVFMDLNNLRISGKIFVTDRDRTVFREVVFLSPVHAAAVADEDWYFAYQDARTRRPISTKKHNPVTVRYYLKKQWGKWIVLEYDVYGRDDALQPVPAEEIIRW